MFNMTPTLAVLAMCMMITCIRCNPCETDMSLVDGCTLPKVFKTFLSEIDLLGEVDQFKLICNGHDICYRCGKTLGFNKNKCDSGAYEYLNEHCKKNGNSKVCRFVAAVMYAAAWKEGDKGYDSYTDTSMCNDPWVTQCLTQ